jgi:hypothetical protein
LHWREGWIVINDIIDRLGPFGLTLIAAAVMPAAFLARRAATRLGLDVASAVLWIFRRKVRKSVLGWVNLRRYCKLALAGSKTEVLLVPGADKSMALKTDEIFVGLRLDAAANVSTTYTNDNILSAGNRIIVIGDPGSGKSSLIKRVFRDLCRAAIETPRGARIPLIVELKDLSKGVTSRDGKDWLLDYVRAQVAEVEGHKMADFFDLYARDDGIVLLLDGLDEVAASEYEAVADQLTRLSQAFERRGDNNTIVLTMRVQFYRQSHRDLEETFPLTLSVKPFRPEDVYEFLSRWFTGPDGPRAASRLYGELADRPSVREMCTNPLILAMYAARHHDVSDTDLPDTRAEFYKSVVDELLVRRGSRQLGNRLGRISQRDDRYAILGRVALDNLLDVDQPANSIDRESAVDAVKKILKLKDRVEAADALDGLDGLASQTGIFDGERSGESIRFIHLTFCEYLAAAELVRNRRDGWQLLMTRHREALASHSSAKSRLIEVIPFAVAMLPPKDHHDALTEVYQLGQRDLYARCVIEIQRYDHANWADYVTAEREWLVARPYEEWDEYWLSRLQIYQTALADSQPTLDGSTGAVDRLFLDLISDQRERLVPLFSAYAAENPRGAFRLSEACGVDLVREAPELLVSECGNPPFLDSCIDVAGSPEANIPDWAAIFVAAGFRSSLVARTLSNQEVPPAWRGSTADLARTENWDEVASMRKPRGPSLYSFSLSLIRHELRSGKTVMFDRVQLLGLPGPLRFLTRDWMNLTALSIGAISLFGSMFLLPLDNAHWAVAAAIFLPFGALAVVSTLLISAIFRRHFSFCLLVNLAQATGELITITMHQAGDNRTIASLDGPTGRGLRMVFPGLARAIRERIEQTANDRGNTAVRELSESAAEPVR